MKSPLTAKTTHPNKDFTAITQIGLKALNLALAYHAAIDPRLPPGTTDGLSEDIDALSTAVPGAKQARDESKSATVAQNAALALGHARVRATRKAVRTSRAPADIQRAYGVGQKMNKTRVRDVKSALNQIIDRATADPVEAAGFGLLATDVDALKDTLLTIAGADATQEQKRASAPLTTRERNQTGNRILLAVARVAGAGMIAFAHNPVELALFEALGAGAAVKKPKKAPAPPAAPAA